jgi:hypothetical protein
MAKSQFKALRAGGRVAGLTKNLHFKIEDYPKSAKYGVLFENHDKDATPKNGSVTTVTLTLGEKNVVFNDRFWVAEAVEKAYKEAGFVDFEWVKYTPNAGSKANNDPFYDDWFKNGIAPLTCFRGFKPAAN